MKKEKSGFFFLTYTMHQPMTTGEKKKNKSAAATTLLHYRPSRVRVVDPLCLFLA